MPAKHRPLLPLLLLLLVQCGDEQDPLAPPDGTASSEAAAAAAALVDSGITFVVNTTDDVDDGGCTVEHCSLREAVNAANTTTERDKIGFAIPGPGPYVIQPQTALPAINRPVILDGRTQAGYDGTPVVELDGRQVAPDGFGQRRGVVLLQNSSGSELWALVLRGFGDIALSMHSEDGSLVAESYIGTDVTGLVADGNGWSRGVFGTVLLAGSRNELRGNVIAGNPTVSQVKVDQGGFHRVVDNLVGLGADGTTVLGGFYPDNGSGHGIMIDGSSQNLVQGNVVGGFPDYGVDIRFSTGPVPNNQVVDNKIGTDASGTVAVANEAGGVRTFSSSANVIEGNLVSGNGGTGIAVSEAGNQVRDNLVGVDAGGTAALPNVFGISVGGSENVVEANLVSGNTNAGISISGFRNVVSDNVVGLDAAGAAAIPNAEGIAFGGREQEIVGNVVAGNTGVGVRGTLVLQSRLQANRVGTNAAGTAVIGNGGHGIHLHWDADLITLEDNVVVGSGTDGVHLQPFGDSVMTGIRIQGNRIGALADGTAAGNVGHGISFAGTTNPEGVVRGALVDENVLAHNGGAGIHIARNGSDWNRIASNRIHDNGGLGIDLGVLGVLANDAGDTDEGANDGQNHPVLTEAITSGSSLLVRGTLDGRTNFGYTIQLFANAACDASGRGEGEIYLGETPQLIHPSGKPLHFEVALDVAVTPGTPVTATARNSNSSGSTSEFSPCLSASAPNTAPSADPGGPYTAAEGSTVTFDGSGSMDADGDDLTFAWNLGDGTTASGATPTHVYADDGTYPVSLTVTEATGTASGSAETTAEVVNVAPTVSAGGDATLRGGATLERDGSFTDPGSADTWTATVDYGDGSGSQTLALDGQAFSLAHAYGVSGTYTVKVTVTDDDGGSGSATFEVTVVVNTPPSVDAGGDARLDEGSTFSRTGSFTDPDADAWTASVDWGDGSPPEALSLSGAAFDLSHTYHDDGTFDVVVTVSDGSAEGTAGFQVVVDNIAPTVEAGGPADVDEGSLFTRDGSFADPGGDTWTATVDYGDGTPVPLGLTGFAFALEATYPDDADHLVRVAVSDDEGAVGHATVPVTVHNVAPAVRMPAAATLVEGDAWDGTGDFADPGVDTWSATVDYGSGATPLSLDGKAFALHHAAADDGTVDVVVRVTDDDGGEGAGSTELVVENAAPVVEAGPDAEIVSGDPLPLSPSFTDRGALDAPWSWSVGWGSGGDEGIASEQGPIAVPAPRLFAAGIRTVRVSVTDKDGALGEDGFQVSILRRPVDIELDPETLNLRAGRNGNGRGGGMVSVAILSTGGFDATRIDVATVRIGDGEGEDVPVALRGNGTYHAAIEDVDLDGRPDLVVRVERQALVDASEVHAATTSFTLRAATTEGVEVMGVAPVRVIS